MVHHKEKMEKLDKEFKRKGISPVELHLVAPDLYGKNRIVVIDTSQNWTYNDALDYLAIEPDKSDITNIYNYINEHESQEIINEIVEMFDDPDKLDDAINEMMINLAIEASKYHKIPIPTLKLVMDYLASEKAFNIKIIRMFKVPGEVSEITASEYFRMWFNRNPANVLYNIPENVWLLGPINKEEQKTSPRNSKPVKEMVSEIVGDVNW